MLVQQYKSEAPVRDLCDWVSLPRNVYYYKHLTGKKGARASTHTARQDGTLVENDQVVDDIKLILSDDFVCYGYKKVTISLREKGYQINEKKSIPPDE